MNCPRCNKEILAGSLTCPYCHVLIGCSALGFLASPGRRLAGNILDSIIWFVMLFIVSFPLAAGGFIGVPISIIFLLLSIISWLTFWANSTSPGKWLLGMKVYHPSGEPVGFFLMLIRETLGKLLSSFVFSLGFVWILIDKDRQCWHDKLACSIVIELHGAKPVSLTHKE